MEVDVENIKESLLRHLSLNEFAHFKSQQVGDPDLTSDEKYEIAKEILERSESLFLSKYGKYLEEKHLEYFKGRDDYEVNFYLAQLTKGKTQKKSQIRNRRLEALKRLCDTDEYFSDEEMKRRNPLLYEELVGQYLSEKEKNEIDLKEPQDRSFFSIFSHILEKNVEDSKLKKEIRDDFNAMGISLESEVSTSVANWGEISADAPSSSKKVLENSRQKDLTESEKELLVNEFRSRVFSDFLGGKDPEFDYSTVDSNAAYDDLEMWETDEQDNYFDTESPKTVEDSET